MRNVIIGFSYPRKFKLGAWLISKWTKRRYSHVFVWYTDDEGRNMVFHAAHGLVHLVSLKNFLKDNSFIEGYSFEFSDSEYEQFRNYYYDKLGQPYSYMQLATMPLRDLGVLKKSENSNGYICSELAGEMLTIVKSVEFKKPSYELKPSDIDWMLFTLGGKWGAIYLNER